jgi:hypothetical protein
VIFLKNRKKVNEGLRSLAKNFEEQKELDRSLQNEIAKEYSEIKIKPGEKQNNKGNNKS